MCAQPVGGIGIIIFFFLIYLITIIVIVGVVVVILFIKIYLNFFINRNCINRGHEACEKKKGCALLVRVSVACTRLLPFVFPRLYCLRLLVVVKMLPRWRTTSSRAVAFVSPRRRGVN